MLDLKSRNGTFVNGRRVIVPRPVSADDQIAVGDFVLGVEQVREQDSVPPAPTPPSTSSAPPPDASQEHARTQRLVHEKLIEAMDLRRLDLDALGSAELWKRTEATTRQIVARMEQTRDLPDAVDREELIGDVLHEALGLGLDVPIRWIVAVERGLTVEADHDQLFRVLVNIARNAMQALEVRGARDPASSARRDFLLP